MIDNFATTFHVSDSKYRLAISLVFYSTCAGSLGTDTPVVIFILIPF